MHKPILCNRHILRPANDITSSVTSVEVIRCHDSADTFLQPSCHVCSRWRRIHAGRLRFSAKRTYLALVYVEAKRKAMIRSHRWSFLIFKNKLKDEDSKNIWNLNTYVKYFDVHDVSCCTWYISNKFVQYRLVWHFAITLKYDNWIVRWKQIFKSSILIWNIENFNGTSDDCWNDI